VLLVVLFVITLANSATFVLGMFTSGGDLEPARWIRLVWGTVPVVVTGVLLLSGGLDALRTVSILAAFPFILLMTFMAAALLRSLREERRQWELHEAILRAELERLVEDRRAAAAAGAGPLADEPAVPGGDATAAGAGAAAAAADGRA